jgi:hypothetical protein
MTEEQQRQWRLNDFAWKHDDRGFLAPDAEPDDLVAELKAQQLKEVRSKIVKGINRHAFQKDIPYGLVWNEVYGTMSRRFGLRVTTKVKLDSVERAGLLFEMLQVVDNL